MSGWIPAAVELPDSDTDVIIHTEDGEVGAGYHDGRVWRWLNACRIDIDVTHWMPFPNAPEDAR